MNGSVTRYVRFEIGTETAYGILEGDSIRRLDGYLLDNPRPTGETVQVSDVKLTIPIEPARVSKIIGVNGNYQVPGMPKQTVAHPPIFAKFATSLVTDGDDVELPAELKDPYLAGSLVLIIGKEGRNIAPEQALEHVFGVVAANDVSDGLSWGREGGDLVPDRMLSKAADTWAPIGSEIVSGLDFSDLAIEVRLNGEVVASGRTSQMINKVEQLIYYTSHYFTLKPGDLIYTGVPQAESGPRKIKPGDLMEVSIEEVGSLRNRCVELKQGGGRHWWHELEEKLAAEQAAAKPGSGS